MKTLFSLLFFVFSTFGFSADWVDLQDTADLPFLNPDLNLRKTAKIRLTNGLEVYLISDPLADRSSAAMAVHVGHWDDPKEYPGMAHLSEHLLFGGSQKFQSDTAFFQMVTDANGQLNAFTAADRTVYFFSACEENFRSIFECFSRFFIDPLFSPSVIDRELHAVDQEFQKNIENEEWRKCMVFRETGNPDHPNALFSIGNSQTLGQIPQSALKKWHAEHYVANQMRLAVYSPLSLESLKAMVSNYCTAIPSREVKFNSVEAPLSSKIQRGAKIWIRPIRQIQNLTLWWELPAELSVDPGKSASLFAYALDRGQPYSLHEELKREGWIEDMGVEITEPGDLNHRFFEIQMDLTMDGMVHYRDVILRCFQAILGLKNSPMPLYLLEEMNNVAKLEYQFQPRQDAFRTIASIGESLFDESMESYPARNLIAKEPNSATWEKLCQKLTPEECIYFFQADPSLGTIAMNHKEEWIGAEYGIEKITKEELSAWQNVSVHPDIHIAGPNPFVAEHFDLISQSSEGSIPVCLHEDDGGIAYYSRVPEYSSPESAFYLHVLTPAINATPKSFVLANLYLQHLHDSLHPTLSSAKAAGYRCRFTVDRNRLDCTLSGFSEKIALLFQTILKQLPLPPPTTIQFEKYRDCLDKELANHSKELAATQAKDLMGSLIYLDRPTKEQQLDALKKITYDDYCQFLRSLFVKNYVQSLFCGNLTQQNAESSWLDVRHLLGGSPYLKSEHTPFKILTLPENTNPSCLIHQTQASGNATLLLIDYGPFSFEKRAVQEILSPVLKDTFFQTLRGRQKTSYIAQSDQYEIDLRLFQIFLVQSNTHQPDDLLNRFEEYLEWTSQNLVTVIPESRFAELKKQCSESLLTRFHNLQEKSALLNQLAFDYNADFSWIEKRLSGYAHLSYDAFIQEAKKLIFRDNRKRIAIEFFGQIEKPFFYSPITYEDMKKESNYHSRILLLEPQFSPMVTEPSKLHDTK